MPIVSSLTTADTHTQIDGDRYISHFFTDHLGRVSKRGPKKVPGADTETEYAIDRANIVPSVLSALAEQEVQEAFTLAEAGINPDKTPDHQTQIEYDRRVLGRAMLLLDAHTFNSIHPMFQAVEIRGGANAIQRAAYLVVTKANYNLIAQRFNNVSGVTWFLTDEKNQIWSELPDEFN